MSRDTGLGVKFDIHREGRRINDAIFAANDNTPGHDPAIRRDLLLACGLKREEEG